MTIIDNPVFLGSIIGFSSAIANVLFSNFFQNSRENKSWIKNQILSSYSDSINGLSALITLSAQYKGNEDAIEKSLVEAKRGLAVSVVFIDREMFKNLEDEILLFITGNYSDLIRIYSEKGLRPSERFTNLNLQNHEMYGSAEIILRRIIDAISLDKRLH